MGQGASMGGVEIEKPEGASIEEVTNGNVALVFVKPHACNEKMVEEVKKMLLAKNLIILGEEAREAEKIEEGGFVDKHYSGICAAAMTSSASDIVVSDEKKEAFKAAFEGALNGKTYDDMVAEGCIINATEAMDKFGQGEPMSPKDLFQMWNLAEAKSAKLAGGVYVRLVQGGEAGDDDEDAEPAPPVWVINGFYPMMRSKYHEEGCSIHMFVVAFKPEDVSWSTFRNDIIGATNPATAAEGSIRATCKAKFAELGLKEEPNNTDNCVHASAGPLEGLKERMIWLGWTLATDPTGSKLIEVCLDKEAGIMELLEDPPIDMYGLGGSKTAFDLTEDKDTKEMYVLANNYTFKDELAEYIK